VVAGSVESGGVADLAVADNQYLELMPEVPAAAGDDPLVVLFNFSTPNINVSQFSVSIENSADTINLQQRVSFFNYTTFMFEQIDVRTVTFNDTNYTITPSGTPQRFIQIPNGQALGEIRYEPVGPVLLYPWTVAIDRLVVNTMN
jgi:hypothetical protein